MQKHGIILNMSCNKLVFWPRHYQHSDTLPAVNTLVKLNLTVDATMFLVSYVVNPINSTAALTKPQKIHTKQSCRSKKVKLIKILQFIPDIHLVYKGVSKLAASEKEKYIVLAKHIFRLMTFKPKAEPIDKIKPIDLAFIGAASFQYLAKQKNIKIFTIFIQDIEDQMNAISTKNIRYQLNKMAMTSIDPKIIVSKKYYEFLDVFSKEASDTLSSHSKYDHQIRLLERYRDYSHSFFSKMSEL